MQDYLFQFFICKLKHDLLHLRTTIFIYGSGLIVLVSNRLVILGSLARSIAAAWHKPILNEMQQRHTQSIYEMEMCIHPTAICIERKRQSANVGAGLAAARALSGPNSHALDPCVHVPSRQRRRQLHSHWESTGATRPNGKTKLPRWENAKTDEFTAPLEADAPRSAL